ncbi:MAG TPA: HAD family hydrolase [Candidatus Paceibacterota bacterium]|nr:HAD family hydrolase [Candidatus Paceibacterota bacterium]
MIKLVVFDWNGVLIADASAAASAVSRILESFGKGAISTSEYRELFSIPAKEIYLKKGMTEKEVANNANRIQEMFHKDYEPMASGVRTRRGARKLLEFLSKRKIECIILSGNTVEGVHNQLERLGLEKYFSNVFANDMYEAIKKRNKLEKLNQFLAQQTFKKSEVLIIGDSTEETQAGKHLGIHTVAITGGFVSAVRLKAINPDFLISNLNQLIGIIEKLR